MKNSQSLINSLFHVIGFNHYIIDERDSRNSRNPRIGIVRVHYPCAFIYTSFHNVHLCEPDIVITGKSHIFSDNLKSFIWLWKSMILNYTRKIGLVIGRNGNGSFLIYVNDPMNVHNYSLMLTVNAGCENCRTIIHFDAIENEQLSTSNWFRIEFE